MRMRTRRIIVLRLRLVMIAVSDYILELVHLSTTDRLMAAAIGRMPYVREARLYAWAIAHYSERQVKWNTLT